MSSFKAAFLGLVMFSLAATAHANTVNANTSSASKLSASCQQHANNLLHVISYAFMCPKLDALSWSDADDRLFKRLELQVLTACENADEQTLEKLSVEFFAHLEGLNTKAPVSNYCQSGAAAVRNILNQYQ